MVLLGVSDDTQCDLVLSDLGMFRPSFSIFVAFAGRLACSHGHTFKFVKYVRLTVQTSHLRHSIKARSSVVRLVW